MLVPNLSSIKGFSAPRDFEIYFINVTRARIHIRWYTYTSTSLQHGHLCRIYELGQYLNLQSCGRNQSLSVVSRHLERVTENVKYLFRHYPVPHWALEYHCTVHRSATRSPLCFWNWRYSIKRVR